MVHGDADINMAEFDPRRFGGWTDTEYTRAKSFEDYNRMYALPAPGEELDTARPQRTSPLYDILKAKGCIHTVAFGWERPKWFSADGAEEEYGFRRNNTHGPVGDECRTVRERVGIMDMSSFAKIDVTGSDAEVLLNRAFANRMPARTGRIALAHGLSWNGGIETECTVTRIKDDHFFVVTGSAWEDRDTDRLRAVKNDGDDVAIANVTNDFGALVLAGSKARDVLAGLTEADLGNDAFPWLTGRGIGIAGIPVRALRVNYVGELGWELYAPMDRLAELYAAIWAAGEPHGIGDFGAYAMNSLRMEKAYKAMTLEMTNEVTLFEAGLARFAKMDKGDFIGRAPTQARDAGGRAFEIIYAEMDAIDADVRGGEAVFAGGACVGVTTSGAYGHATGKSLFFAYVGAGTPTDGLEVQILGERRAAALLGAPAYDPNNEKLRG